MKIAHIADVHIRGLSRHDEYEEILFEFINDIKKRGVQHVFIGGDVFHTKTSGISPEYIEFISKFLRELSVTVEGVTIILGNHDGNLTNLSRQDAVSPIINALQLHNVSLHKHSGVYNFAPNMNWCVYSLFDDNWERVKPIIGDINIACYHGPVKGAISESDWKIDEGLSVDHFLDYDFCFLGDIHRTQYLGFREINGQQKPWIAYPGSTIQQNYAESLSHGYLLWDIESRDNFDVVFCELPNPRPFITIDWNGTVDETYSVAKTYPLQTRFRIKHGGHISHNDCVKLTNLLKGDLRASEVTFKGEIQSSNDYVNARETIVSKDDLRSPDSLLKLIKTYHSTTTLTSDETDKLLQQVKSYLSNISDDEFSARNISWSLKHLKFDNLFCYGEGNEINFQNLNGIVGIFGPNRSGKSSLPGTLMYSLFNNTDRGAIKNLHVVNSRKTHGYSRVILEANGSGYVIERQTVKTQNKRNETNASTSLNFFKLAPDSTLIDLCGEQRTDTEKTIRNCIGSAEDLSMTSLSAQDDLSTVVKVGPTKRAELISKFLDLDIFYKMWKNAQNDVNTIKLSLKKFPAKQWDQLIVEKKNLIEKFDNRMIDISNEINLLRSKLVELNKTSPSTTTFVTEFDIQQQKDQVLHYEKRLFELEKQKKNSQDNLTKFREKLSKISLLQSENDITSLRAKRDELRKLEQLISSTKHEHKQEEQVYKQQKKTLKMLDNVPCGDAFPTCHYIADAIVVKHQVVSQEIKVNSLLRALDELNEKLSSFELDVDKKIKQLEELSSVKEKLTSDSSKEEINILKVDSTISENEKLLDNAKKRLNDLVVSYEKNENVELIATRNKINEIQKMLSTLEDEKISLASKRGRDVHAIETLEHERASHDSLLQDLKLTELISTAFNKKGLPSLILDEQLPLINAEISKILSGIVDFTVELQRDDSERLELYLNYGDSRRIIELGSGMEKALSSIAIRTAFMNISSLPKSDFFIIDEGFGVFDESGIEAVTRMLVSLKKYFRLILVITHIDGIKDCADNIIEITKNEKDSKVIVK